MKPLSPSLLIRFMKMTDLYVSKTIRFILFCAVLLTWSPLVRGTIIEAVFDGGNSSTAVDGYTGTAGNGWLSGWTVNKGSSTYVSFANTVTNSTPLDGGANYLVVSLSNSSTTADYGGAVARQFDTTLIDTEKPYQVAFLFRGDSAIDQTTNDTNSQYAFFGSISNSASGIDANTTWAVAATYSGGALQWRYYNGTTTLVTTGVNFTAGTLYCIVVTIGPASHTYAFTISDGTTNYTSPSGLGFRNAASSVNKVFFAAKVDKDHSGAIQFSIDDITIDNLQTTTGQGFPWQIGTTFTAGNLSSHADGYPGVAGAGWLTAWVTKTSGVALINTVTSASPIGSSGNRLNVTLSYSGTATTGTGATSRKFDTRIINATAPYVIEFDLRLDSALANASDKVVIFGDLSTSHVYSTGASNTFCIQGNYNSGNPAWYLLNGTQDGGAGTLVSTGFPFTVGTVYHFSVHVDPVARTWTVTIDNGTAQYASTTLGFRAAASSEGGNTLYFGGIVRNTTISLAYSVDNILISSEAESSSVKDWPQRILPFCTGVASHFNTKVDFASATNSTAMDQARDAGLRIVRYCMPWQDVERVQGTFFFDGTSATNSALNNTSYPPGYSIAEASFTQRGYRPILCLAFQNSQYSSTTKLTTTAALDGFERYCYEMAYRFRDDNPIFEIWNEPNLSSFGGYTAAEYMVVVQRAVNGVIAGWRAGRDTTVLKNPIIIGPAVSGTWASGNFFDQCLDAGLLNYVDGLSYHPYCYNNADAARRIPEIVADSTNSLKAELVSRGKSHMPLVFTEWGWTTGTLTYEVDTATQAKYAVRQVLAGYYNGIAINCLYSLEDARNVDITNIADKHFGLFSTAGADYEKVMTAKPAVAALTHLSSELNGYAYVQRVNLGDDGTLDSTKDWCLVFWNPSTGAAKAAVWTIETGVTKTTPDLKSLLNLSASATTNFTDNPTFISLPGYHP